MDGTIYGYPNEINTYALNYNKRLFAEAGIDGAAGHLGRADRRTPSC